MGTPECVIALRTNFHTSSCAIYSDDCIIKGLRCCASSNGPRSRSTPTVRKNNIRTVVTKRKISGGTVSEAGKLARDTMLGLMKTCAKLCISYYQSLGDRLHVQGAEMVPALPSLITAAAA